MLYPVRTALQSRPIMQPFDRTALDKLSQNSPQHIASHIVDIVRNGMNIIQGERDDELRDTR